MKRYYSSINPNSSSHFLLLLLKRRTSSSAAAASALQTLEPTTPDPHPPLNQLFRILCRRDWYRSPYLKRQAPLLTPLHVSHLLSLPLPSQTALSFFHWLSRRHNLRHSPQSHSSLLQSLLKSPPLLPDPTDSIALSMIDSCASPDDVRSVLDPIRSFKSSLLCYNSLLMSLSSFGMVDEMRGVFSRMLEEGEISPDIFTYSSLALAYCKIGDLDEAKVYVGYILDAGLSPDTFTYNSLMLGHYKNRDLDGARKVFDEMPEKGCRRDLFSYNILIQGLCGASRIDEALVMFEKMGDDGCCPDEHTCMLLIKALCRSRRSEDWFQFVSGDWEEGKQA